MLYMLFTVSVTALAGSVSIDGNTIQAFAEALAGMGIVDGAVTAGDGTISFTGQIEAGSLQQAMVEALWVPSCWGLSVVSANADLLVEEACADNQLRVAI